MSIAPQIDRLLAGEDLGRGGAQEVLARIMSGDVDPVQTGAFLIALRAKGETADELAGLASAIRERSVRIDINRIPLVDTCGTGGGASTFNVSTAAAFVVAGAGVSVAKHGNRSATSQSGSADVLEHLGAQIDLPPESVVECIDRTGVGFMFAPSYHPAFRHVVPVRKSLAVRTAFNILGPMVNPAGVRRQVVGIADRGYLDRIAGALHELGVDRALVVSADDGLDEVSTGAPTEIADVTPDGVRRYRFDPAGLGFAPPDRGRIAGGDPGHNARLITEALEGGSGSAADLIVLNAAAALCASGTVATIEDAVEVARESLTSGQAAERLAAFVAVTNELSPATVEGA